MALTSEQQARLAELDEILATGVSQVSEDGRMVHYDVVSMRRERDALRQLAAGVAIGSRFRRVVLGG